MTHTTQAAPATGASEASPALGFHITEQDFQRLERAEHLAGLLITLADTAPTDLTPIPVTAAQLRAVAELLRADIGEPLSAAEWGRWVDTNPQRRPPLEMED